MSCAAATFVECRRVVARVEGIPLSIWDGYTGNMEAELIRWLRAHVPADPRAPLGLSDDAALIKIPGARDLVVTTDTATDGVDFRVGEHAPERIGRQALGINLSDLAAMAARPLAAVVSLVLPRSSSASGGPLDLAIALYGGILPLAAEFDVAIAGGDTNTYDGPLVISVTAFGQVAEWGPLTRSGGRVGDWLLVTGSLGGSILGHMLDFTPRVREAQVLAERYALRAGIDISDGLALDASRLAAASGCGAVLYPHQVPISPAAHELSAREMAESRESAALRHALSDGQDFELLIAASREVAQSILGEQPLDCRITHVGELVAERGLWQQNSDGTRRPLEPIGWLHQ
jgi:thiamine-monophosphate kinase